MKTDKNIKINYSFINLLTASDLSRRRLPFMSIASANPGPTVVLTACIHGDEVGGMVIIQEIFKIIKKTLSRGKVYAFPLLNPFGFERHSRFINLSEEDLNRSFPGKKDGNLAERIAYQIFNAILEKKPDLVLDLHNDWIKSIPFNLVDYSEEIAESSIHEKVKEISKQTGLLTILDSEDIERTLSGNLIKKGIPALTMELGEPYVINEESVRVGVGAIMNVLKKLGMSASTGEIFVYPAANTLLDKTLRYSEQVSSSSGIIRFYAKPGNIVKPGETVAKIYNAFGKLQETINSLNRSVVLGHADYSASFPGAPVMSFGNF